MMVCATDITRVPIHQRRAGAGDMQGDREKTRPEKGRHGGDASVFYRAAKFMSLFFGRVDMTKYSPSTPYLLDIL